MGSVRPELRRLTGFALLAMLAAAAALFGSGPAGQQAHGQTGSQARLTYPPGWNLIAGPVGTVIAGANGPLYTYGATDSVYRQIPAASPLQSAIGYWAYFDALAPQTLPAGGPFSITVQLPAGHYVMIGNPRSTISVVFGADIIYIYDPVQGYQSTLSLQPGQGAWAYSADGATITIANAAP